MVIEGDTKGQDLNGGSFSTKLDLTHPLIRSRTTTLRGNFGLEKKHFYNKQKDDFSSEYNTYNLFVGSNFEQNTNFIFGGVLSGFITTNFGYNDYTNSIQSFKDTKNFEKSENEHVKLNLNLNYTQFFNDSITGIFKLNSQISESNLDSSQKLYLGGAEGVRAYPSSEGSGDNGILINNEIYMDINNNLTLGAFYDYGRVQQYVHNTPNSTTGLSLSGTNQNIYSLHGYGIKLDYNLKNLSANLTVAERLNKNPIRSAANLDSNGDVSRTQAWFQLNLSY
jgi:hemolysin activation/secretion protein